MIRVVLAVALATALVGVSLPVAERAERDRNAALATGELQRFADRADRLARENDPVEPGGVPAATTVIVDPPDPVVTDGGRILVAGTLVWQSRGGPNETVEPPVSLRVESPIRAADRTRLRLSLVRVDGGAAVRVERARVQTRSRGETAHVRRVALVGT